MTIPVENPAANPTAFATLAAALLLVPSVHRPLSGLKQVPAAVAALLAAVAPTLSLAVDPVQRKATANLTPRQVFSTYSPALTGAQFHVDFLAGNNANDGSVNSKVKSIYQAHSLGNATGAPYTVHVYRSGTAGSYDRSNHFLGAGNIRPTQDVAYIAHGGVIDTHTGDNSLSYTEDPTYKGLYTATVNSVSTVVDLLGGSGVASIPPALPRLTSAEAVRYQPGWFHSGTTLTVRRPDGRAPFSTTTRVLRPVSLFSAQRDINVGFFGDTSGDGWSLMGGVRTGENPVTATEGGCASYFVTSASPLPDQYKCFVAENMRVSHGYRGFEIYNLHGLVYLNECGGAFAFTDQINIHKGARESKTLVVALNGWGRTTGVSPQESSQSFTLHDGSSVIGLTLCNDWRDAKGGNVRNITGSLWVSYCDTFGYDAGDGFLALNSVRVDDTGTTAWLYEPRFVDRPEIDMAAVGGAKILVTSVQPYRGVGDVSSWS